MNVLAHRLSVIVFVLVTALFPLVAAPPASADVVSVVSTQEAAVCADAPTSSPSEDMRLHRAESLSPHLPLRSTTVAGRDLRAGLTVTATRTSRSPPSVQLISPGLLRV